MRCVAETHAGNIILKGGVLHCQDVEADCLDVLIIIFSMGI